MGGRPLAAFLSLALPKGFELDWVDGFLRGFGELAERYGVELAGGDTAEAPGAEVLTDVMVVGAVEEGRALLRSGAKVGDAIYVTGTLGGSAVELEEMRVGAVRRVRGRDACPQSFPEARVDVGRELGRLASLRDAGQLEFASSCMDLSDGLSLDLRRLCEASGVGAEVSMAGLPVAAGASFEQALDGGEDYELLFTAHGDVVVPREIAGVKVSRIGMITTYESGLRLVDHELKSRELLAGGWVHFAGR